jgi:hypothetical protein
MANKGPRGDNNHQLEGMVKKACPREGGGPSSKAAAILTRGAYMEYVSTAKRRERCWRLFSTFPVLKQLTSTAGELLALSGPRNPYKAGKLGVIEEGAYADLLLVDGNPLKDITVIGGTDQWFDADPEWKPIESLKVIMKDGKIYKNTLAQ